MLRIYRPTEGKILLDGAARIANRILVLEQGHLIEDGTHEELIKQQGVYQKLYEIQAQWYVS